MNFCQKGLKSNDFFKNKGASVILFLLNISLPEPELPEPD